MTNPEDESRPVLPPSRFGAGYSVGGDDVPQQPVYPAYPAPEPPPPSAAYAPPVQYPQLPVQYSPVTPQYPVAVPVAYVPTQSTNGFAIAALVCPLVLCVLFPLGIIFGHVALSQIARTGEGGRGMAIAGLVISYVEAALALFYFLLIGVGLSL